MWPTTACCFQLLATCFFFLEQPGAPVAHHHVLLQTAGDLFLLEQPGAPVALHNVLL